MIGPLDEVDEDASRGLGVKEGDLRSPGPRARHVVDDAESGGARVAHGFLDVGDPEGDVMQPLPAPRHEPRDVPLVDHLLIAVGPPVLEELEVRVAPRAKAARRLP